MRGVDHTQADDHPRDYVARTRVRSTRFTDHETSVDPITLTDFVRQSDPSGTPEFRSWLHRQVARLRTHR